MYLQLIRNATLKLHYAGHVLLIDPFFAPKHSRPSFTGKSPNPTVDLPIPIEQILDRVEMVFVSHLHADHFDPLAWERVPKQLPLYCQPGDEITIREKGFEQVTPIDSAVEWNGISLTRTIGHHGLGEVEQIMKNVCGVVIRAAGEPTVYWAGDTVLTEEVRSVIASVQPDVIVTHSCGAKWSISSGERELIVMDAAQTLDVCRLAPANAIVIATHMESLDHATVTRADLRSAAAAAGISAAKLFIPDDGESVKLG